MSTTTLDTAAVRRWKRYPEYRACRTDSLHELPAHWSLNRLKYAARINSEVLDDTTDPDYELRYIDIGNVDSIGQVIGEQSFRFEDAPSRARRRVRHGDVIISTVRTYLRAISYIDSPPDNLIVSTGFAVLRPGPDFDARYLWRLVQSNEFVDSVVAHSEGVGYPAINPSELAGLPLWLPPLAEQRAIAAFLDRETGRIDALIERKGQLIALLEEKRQAVISQAVTRGLDPAVPLKDSGVPWLGAVPRHWQFGPLRRFWEVVDCKHVTVPFFDEGFPVASVMEVRNFDLDLSQVLRTSEQFYKLLTGGNRQPIRGDVIYCRNTANTGTSAYVGTDESIAIGQDVSLIRSRRQNGRYLNYILHSNFMAGQLATLMVGSTFKRINVADIKALQVVCPPRKGQDEIVEYIESKTTKVDSLTAETQGSIELLREYRTALISAAVTGQIDVREQV
jgi:type I restriction enzyme S subunit